MLQIFTIVPLSWNEWKLVLLWSTPVILLDEILKFFGRALSARAYRTRIAKSKSE